MQSRRCWRSSRPSFDARTQDRSCRDHSRRNRGRRADQRRSSRRQTVPDIGFHLHRCKCYVRALESATNQPWSRSPVPSACCNAGSHLTRSVQGGSDQLRARVYTPDPLRLPGDQYDYISPQDGSHISSKRAHRDHLKRHNMVELGNEKPTLKPHSSPLFPRQRIREEMKNNVERMKSHGTWREV
jgi:hypothetical protein